MTPLRDYQRQALLRVSTAWQQGRKRVLLCSPTGSGKTRLAVEAALRACANGKRVLWLAHRRELIFQASERLLREGLCEHGRILADTPQNAPHAPVQVASVDTLRARDLTPNAHLIVWDEAHHCAAHTWKEIHQSYLTAYHLGLTATPERGDGRPLGDLFDELLLVATLEELTRTGYLVPCTVETPDKKLAPHELAKAPLSAWKEKTRGKPTLLFAANVSEAYHQAGLFKQAGVAAAALDGTTPAGERDLLLRRFAQGELKVLCNVSLLTEGWDCPKAEVCLIARPVGTMGLWLQMIGRVLRPAPGKTRAVVLDLCGNVHEHGPLEAPRRFTLERGIELATKKAGPSLCPSCRRPSAHYPCRACGYQPKAPRKEITFDELRPFEELEPEKKRAALLQLEALTEFARERGFKPGWVWFEFRRLVRAQLPASFYPLLEQRLFAPKSPGRSAWDPEPR